MKICFALAFTATFLLSLVPARADTIYPIQRCHVFDDTDYIQIAGQCGTVGRFYPRRLFVRAVRKLRYYGCQN
jgi:hypothetical protein